MNSAPKYGSDSLWKDSAGIDLTKARELAARLEKRGEARDEIEAREAYLDLLGIAAGQTVIDVGCGSGVVTRAIARRVGPSGRVIGVDPSGAFLAIARENADRAGVGGQIEFREGGALALPVDTGVADAVIAVTVLAHMHDGVRAIPEMVRVARAGGRVGAFDFDGDMTVFTHPDRAMTRRVVAATTDAAAVDGWIARALPGLFARAGLVDVRVRGFFPIDGDPDGFYVQMAERSASAAEKSGALTAEESRQWLDAFRAELSRGPVVAGRLHIFAWGTKP